MLNSEVMHGKGGGCSIHTKLGDMWVLQPVHSNRCGLTLLVTTTLLFLFEPNNSHIVYFNPNIRSSMARQDSRKRRFLGFGKHRSASNLPVASAQGAGSAAEISGGTFRRRLATVRRLFSRRNLRQPVSGPSGVPPEDVNEAVSDSAEPQPASATAGKSAEDAVRRFDDIHPISHLGEGAIELVTFADTPYIDIQNVEGYIKPFVVFNEVIITLSKVHPYAQIALGVLVLAAQVFIRQGNLDKAVFDLLQTVRRVYEFLAEEDTIKNFDQMKDTLAKIARVISDSAQFIKNYSETKSFWKRTLKNVYSETQNIVDDYTMTLCDLMQQYRDRTTRDIRINMYRVLESLNLDGMAYAGGAGLDTTKACLDGTRTEVLRHITDWIDSRVDAPRIMWLHGQAGRGKSAIAHTIAMWVKDSGGLGSCFCFERDRLAEHREEKMLTTIARDLADRDPAFRRALANVVSVDHSLKTTRDVTQQWRRLLLGPLSEANAESIGNVVVVIDALDESGPETSRSCILSLLTSQEAAHLPTNFRILITSRQLPDIAEAFSSCQHVTVTSLDDVPPASTEHDISLFISNELRHRNLDDVIGQNEIDQITQKSDGLFEWARLACEFIKWKRAGRSLRERFNDVITLGSEEGSTLLDRTYTTILETAIPSRDRISLLRFHSVMQQILTMLVPLPMVTLQHMRKYFPNEKDHYEVVDILEFMAPVLGGINDSSPVRPLHMSFYDFLADQSRSGDYFIDTSQPYNLAFASLHILCKELQFNICRLESSYLSNSGVPDLQQRINKYIAPHLSYSCQFWAQHLHKTSFDLALAKLVAAIVGSERFMFWLEIESIIGDLGQAVDALVHTVAWLQGQVGFEDALEMIQEEIKFVHHFGSAISHSTPHLYISALPLAPSNSRLSKMLLPRFCNLVGVAVGGLEEWTTTLLALEGHANEVNAVAFSPDGRTIVSGSNDNTVRLWDVGGCIQTLQGQTVRPWDAGGCIQTLHGHTDQVRSVAFSPDGKRVVSGSDDKTVRVWDVGKGVQCGSPLQGHTHWVHSVTFSPDGKRVVSGSADMTVRVWDAGGGMQIGHPLQGHVGVVQSVAFSPDGQRIASGSDDASVRVWDAENGMQLGRPLLGHAGRVLSVGFAPDGRRIVSSAADGTIRIWDSEEGVQIGNPLNGHTDWVISVAFSPDGNRIASASADTTVRVWDVEAGRQFGSPLQGHTHRIQSVAFSPDGKRIVSGSEDKTVRVWDAEGCAQPGSTVQGHMGMVLSVAFSPDSKGVISGSEDKTVRIWDAERGVQIGNPFQGHTDWVHSVACSPDGKRIVSASDDMTIRIWDAESGVQIGSPLQGHIGWVLSVAYSPDGRTIVSGSEDKTVRIWDVEGGVQIGNPLQGHTGRVHSVVFSPDGKRIASGSDDTTLKVWDAEGGTQIGSSLQGHTHWVLPVAFSPDGKKIASGSEDKTVRVWDAEGRVQIGSPLQGHTGAVFAVGFSPDGGRIVSGSSDKTVRVWDAERSVQLYCLPQGHTGAVSTVAFSPGGRRIVSGSYDSTMRIWDVQLYEGMITGQQQFKLSPSTSKGALVPSHVMGDVFKSLTVCFSSIPSHALHDSEQLLDGFHPDAANGWFEPVKLHPDGWIKGPREELLLWLPPTCKRPFHSGSNIAVIPNDSCTELDMSYMVHGNRWYKCLRTAD